MIAYWPFPAWACGQSCSSLGLWKGFSKAREPLRASLITLVSTKNIGVVPSCGLAREIGVTPHIRHGGQQVGQFAAGWAQQRRRQDRAVLRFGSRARRPQAVRSGTKVLCWFWRQLKLATLMLDLESPQWQPAPSQPPWLPDRQGWSTLLAGALLLLISFLANYGDDHLLQFGSLPASDQIGMGLHLAALAALAGDAQLATRLRHRAANEAARNREQASRRARIQAGFLVAQCRFLLADTSRNRLQLSEALAVLLEENRLQKP